MMKVTVVQGEKFIELLWKEGRQLPQIGYTFYVIGTDIGGDVKKIEFSISTSVNFVTELEVKIFLGYN